MRSTRKYAAAGLAVAAALGLAACSSSSPPSSSGKKSSGHVTLTWWNNATADPLKGVYLSVIKSFEATHPGVAITDVPIQNEQFTTAAGVVVE